MPKISSLAQKLENYCFNGGSMLSEKVSSKTQKEKIIEMETDENRDVICPNCEKPIKGEYTFYCPNCGISLLASDWKYVNRVRKQT